MKRRRSVRGRDAAAPVQRARLLLAEIWQEAVAAVDPAACVSRSLNGVEAPTYLLAVGKAAERMSLGAAAVYGSVKGLAITLGSGQAAPGLDLVVGDHPLPGRNSLLAGRRILLLCRGLSKGDHLLVLLSGGASAMMELPMRGVALRDLRKTTTLLMEAGADIVEVNTVRTHLSQLKGGGLAGLALPAKVTTLALSDVVDDDPAVIGSGPTVPPKTTPRAALRVLDRYRLRDRVPQPVVSALEATTPSPARPTPPPGEYRVIANMAAAAAAAAAAAERRGLAAVVLTTRLAGEARTAAAWALQTARASEAEIGVLAGETSVVVRGDGLGGRNQEAALAAALEIRGSGNVVFLAAGTDGIDGPTPAAGGVVDGWSVERAGGPGAARAALDRNDSSSWLMAAGDQLVTGPTGTNVGDLWLVWTHT